jgi:hypothetical protein
MLMTRGTSVQGRSIPQQHIVRQIGPSARAPAEDMQRRALVFPSVPAQVGRARPPGTRPLQSDLSRTRDSTSTTRGRVCPVRHLNRDPNRGHIKPTFQ